MRTGVLYGIVPCARAHVTHTPEIWIQVYRGGGEHSANVGDHSASGSLAPANHDEQRSVELKKALAAAESAPARAVADRREEAIGELVDAESEYSAAIFDSDQLEGKIRHLKPA